MDALLETIARGTARAPGQAFFQNLVEHLALAAGVRYALVGEIADVGCVQARTLAVWGGEGLVDELEYALEGTPCGDVVSRGLCVHPSGIRALYPRDAMLEDMGAESYVGTPLRDRSGRVIGLVAVMGTTALEETSRLASILQIFASRAETELERALAETALRESEALCRTLAEDSPAVQAEVRHLRKMQAIGQLAGGVAHDFNNQLAVVSGYADLLIRRGTDASGRRWAEGIRDAARRSADLTRQLLLFARKGAGQPTKVDLHPVLRDTAEMLRRSIDRRIRIVLELGAPSAWVMGDATQLQSAVLNLCVNARDAMAEGGVLTLRTSEDEAGLVVDVVDTGIGMTEDVKARVFEPFFTTKAEGTGTGMGLAAVYGTVTQHGGRVSVTSEPEQGSTFRIHLPLTEGAVGPTRKAPPAEAPRSGLRVLVVDDEPAVRDVVTAMLAEDGHEVICAANGEEAVALYSERFQTLDVVILDMVMPDIDGAACFRRLRAVNPAIRVLLSSGNAAEVQVASLMAEGVRGFLHKPFQRDELMGALAEIVGRQIPYRMTDSPSKA